MKTRKYQQKVLTKFDPKKRLMDICLSMQVNKIAEIDRYYKHKPKWKCKKSNIAYKNKKKKKLKNWREILRQQKCAKKPLQSWENNILLWL